MHAFRAFSNPRNHSFIMGNSNAPKLTFLAKPEATGTLILNKTLLEIRIFKESDNCIKSIYSCVSFIESDVAYTKQRSFFLTNYYDITITPKVNFFLSIQAHLYHTV